MFRHDPVLIREISEIIEDAPHKQVIVDATLGLGGHAQMMLSKMSDAGTLIGIDRDQDNLDPARETLETMETPVTRHFIHSSFAHLDDILDALSIPQIDIILYDLGVSSAHYDDAERGFSIRGDAPLDMRFDRTRGQTAHDLIMTASELELRNLMYRYADEKKAPHIARAIVEHRKIQPLNTTVELVDLIRKASYDPQSSKRVFQALRIAVNHEFDQIETSIPIAIDRLAPGGLILVITFHSIEDRIVKHIFDPYLEATIDDITGQTIKPSVLRKYTKKPIEPTQEEINSNPRSRSARLRVYQKNS